MRRCTCFFRWEMDDVECSGSHVSLASPTSREKSKYLLLLLSDKEPAAQNISDFAQKSWRQTQDESVLGPTPWQMDQEELGQVAGQRLPDRRTRTRLPGWTQPETASIPTPLPTWALHLHLSAAISFHQVFVWECFRTAAFRGRNAEGLDAEWWILKVRATAN